jgi:putative flippase GtrA
MISKNPAYLRKMFRFAASGGTAAAVYFVAHYAITQVGLGTAAASLAAYCVAFPLGYLLQRTWTFEGAHQHRAALPRYLAVQVACALLTSVQMGGLGHILDAPDFILSGIATIMASGLSFVACQIWVFPRERA